MSQQASVLSKSAGTSTVGPTANPAPIVELARFLGQALSLSYSLFSRSTVAVIRSLAVPLAVLFRPIIYLLAPVIVLTQVVLDIFVFTPYAIALSIARNVYPLYVFVGAAAICALAVGLVARMLSTGLVHTLFVPSRPRKAKDLPEERPVSVEPRSAKSAIKAGSKPRIKKRVSIKEEREK